MKKGFRACHESFIVTSKASKTGQPGKGSFHNPSFALHLKTPFAPGEKDGFLVDEYPHLMRSMQCRRNDLHSPMQMLVDPITQGTCVSFIGKQMRDAWQWPGQR